MIKKYLFISFCLVTLYANAQIAGKHAYSFLNLVTTTRSAALGGNTTTNTTNAVDQALYNPASITDAMHKKLAVNYSNYLADVSYGSASYAYTLNQRLTTLHAGVTYVGYGTFQGRDVLGDKTTNFSANELALSLGYAHAIANSKFRIGGHLKMISSTLERYSSLGIALDAGVLYTDIENRFQAGFVVRSLGTQLTTYAGSKESLPLQLNIGCSQELEHVPIRWHITLENLQSWNIAFANPNRATQDLNGTTTQESISFLNELARHVILGVELFPGKKFSVQTGYNFRRAAELSIEEQRTFSGFSIGFGLHIKRLHFQYSYAKYSTASNASFLGLLVNLE